jgi:sterol desaturase/sphingolipid hydroxylase (fatty acid hydroxylase superfamily)
MPSSSSAGRRVNSDAPIWRVTPSWWRRLEALLFAAVFAYTVWGLAAGLTHYAQATAGGEGFIADLLKPFHEGKYHDSVLAVVGLLIALLTLWELVRFFIAEARKERAGGPGKAARVFRSTALEYQPTFFAGLLLGLLPRLIVIDVFWLLLPHFEHLALFDVGYTWYGWLYALLAWDLSMWLWHYAAHKVRLLWCLHSPHHAPQNLNMTVAWVHFFAEGYWSALVQVPLLMLLGVESGMLVVLMAFEVTWGTFIHAGERSFRTGRFGPARFFIITPSYHRVHHAKNPLYMDTNFCSLLPFWDWMFGTLQPLRDEVKIEYGITREVNVTSFVDFYFGEFLLLARDLRTARGWRERLAYLVMPPGWAPGDPSHTASSMKRRFLADHPELRAAGAPALLVRLMPLVLLVMTLGFAPPAIAAERKPVEFGVCFHHGAYGDEYTPEAAKVLDDLRAAGPFWIRGDYEDPAKDAPFVADMGRKGIRVLALLPWYSRNIAGWPALVRKEVHGVHGVAAWEIANEPEMSWWGGPIAPGDYMKMLRDAHSIIRSGQPDSRIVAPAVGATEEGVAYLGTLIDAGLLEYVDAVSVHYYVFHRSQQLEAVKRLVAGRKPIWITETGWTTADQAGGEAAQRKYVEEYYDPERGILGGDPDIEVIFNYQLNDEHYPAPPDKDSGWGLTYGPEGAFGKKLAYDEFRKLLARDP